MEKKLPVRLPLMLMIIWRMPPRKWSSNWRCLMVANKIFLLLRHHHLRCPIPLCMTQMMITTQLHEIDQEEKSKNKKDTVKQIWCMAYGHLQLQRKLMKVESLKHILKLFPTLILQNGLLACMKKLNLSTRTILWSW